MELEDTVRLLLLGFCTGPMITFERDGTTTLTGQGRVSTLFPRR